MTLEELIIDCYRKGITSPTQMVAAAKELDMSVKLKSVQTTISLMRKEIRLPKRQNKPKPSFYQEP